MDMDPIETPGWRHRRQPRPEPQPQTEPEANPETHQRRRHYGPRKCRICLDEVQPSFEPAMSGSFMGRNPKPTYISDDPDLGRLMSPCLCKGSQKYVHEGCLEAWRHANLAERNLWKCPTCSFEYRMGRLSMGRFLAHWATNVALTLLVVLFAVFLLGFAGDKIIDLYTDPWGSVFGRQQLPPRAEDYRTNQAIKALESTWSFHFIKGFFSLGVLGFFKTALASPFYYFNIGGGRRRRGDGRDRYMDISLTVVVIGTATFAWAAWKAVRAVTKIVLDRIKNTIVDVQPDDDEDEDI